MIIRLHIIDSNHIHFVFWFPYSMQVYSYSGFPIQCRPTCTLVFFKCRLICTLVSLFTTRPTRTLVSLFNAGLLVLWIPYLMQPTCNVSFPIHYQAYLYFAFPIFPIQCRLIFTLVFLFNAGLFVLWFPYSMQAYLYFGFPIQCSLLVLWFPY